MCACNLVESVGAIGPVLFLCDIGESSGKIPSTSPNIDRPLNVYLTVSTINCHVHKHHAYLTTTQY